MCYRYWLKAHIPEKEILTMRARVPELSVAKFRSSQCEVRALSPATQMGRMLGQGTRYD
jgi:hypothetical protein